MREREFRTPERTPKYTSEYWAHPHCKIRCEDPGRDYRELYSAIHLDISEARRRADSVVLSQPEPIISYYRENFDSPFRIEFSRYPQGTIFKFTNENWLREEKNTDPQLNTYYGVLASGKKKELPPRLLTFRTEMDGEKEKIATKDPILQTFPYDYFKLGEVMHVYLTKTKKSFFQPTVTTKIERFDRIMEVHLLEYGEYDGNRVREAARLQDINDRTSPNRYRDQIRMGRKNQRKDKKDS